MKIAVSMGMMLLLTTQLSFAADAMAPDEAKELFTKGSGDWSDYLTDSASGSISAAGLLGISGESVTPVENVRSLVVGLQGLSDDGEAFGVSLTPARTGIAPMDLYTYSQSFWFRLLGSLTGSYARGTIEIGDQEYDRSAFAVDTNAFFSAKDDPVLAYATSEEENCRLPQQEPIGNEAAPGGAEDPARSPMVVDGEEVRQRFDRCRAQVMRSLRWNRSQFSLSYGAGRIKPEDGSKSSTSLGRTLALGATYGFDHFPKLRSGYALALTYRRTTDEPVLDTLAQVVPLRRDNSLLMARLSGGSQTRRILLEGSDARANHVTASQRAFKQAVGIDVQVFEGVWLNVRIGRQEKIDGSGDESSSLFSLSYSPKALLPR
jgi:hypothetical protein